MEQKLEEIQKTLQESNNHYQVHCINEERIARLEEKVKTIFLEQNKLDETLELINRTQIQLLQEITHLNSIINTLKWTLGILIAVFGGVFVFILSEIIKLI
ncbi:MAG: hypothetical protein J6Y78_10895 [Paludibacteraceae bacterium]|nr:hypothetical protein [Paludibacteraceae bacterium]